jgi:hypothetical protein
MPEKVVHWLIALGAAGWLLGAVIQLVKYGLLTTPCCG